MNPIEGDEFELLEVNTDELEIQLNPVQIRPETNNLMWVIPNLKYLNSKIYMPFFILYTHV